MYNLSVTEEQLSWLVESLQGKVDEITHFTDWADTEEKESSEQSLEELNELLDLIDPEKKFRVSCES